LPLIRLAVLDVDGTLKQAESPYQHLHQRLGVAHLAEVNRELALAGRISYGEWLRRDAALWAGQSVDRIRRLSRRIRTSLAHRAFALKAAGVVALVSAGFTLNTDPVMREFGLIIAGNELTTHDGVFDGSRSTGSGGRQG
jgi:HAD superfamily phosphoserine phosphatase-like hydrolase